MMQCTNPNCAELGTHTNRHQTIEGKPCCVICDLPLGLLADSHEESICKPGQIVRIGPHTTDFLLIENAEDNKVFGIHFLGSSIGVKRSICMHPTALDLEKIRQWIHTQSYALRTQSTCDAWIEACVATLEAIHKIKFPTPEKSTGKKFDADKTQYHYMPLHSLEQINQVLMHGANKYGAENWRQVEGWEHRYYNAALRHIFAHRQGEKLDPESGKSHLAHAICSLIFLIEMERAA